MKNSMHEKPKSRYRLRDLYQENMSLTIEYAQLRQRLLDINLASVRNKRAIDNLLLRLQAACPPCMGH